MRLLRILIATLLAPLVPLLVFYCLGLIMDGPDPVPGRELNRIAFLAVPGALLVYPWAIIGWPVVVFILTRLQKTTLTAFATGGFLLGALPAAIGALNSDSLQLTNAVLVFGIGGVLAAIAWRSLAGYLGT